MSQLFGCRLPRWNLYFGIVFVVIILFSAFGSRANVSSSGADFGEIANLSAINGCQSGCQTNLLTEHKYQLQVSGSSEEKERRQPFFATGGLNFRRCEISSCESIYLSSFAKKRHAQKGEFGLNYSVELGSSEFLRSPALAAPPKTDSPLVVASNTKQDAFPRDVDSDVYRFYGELAKISSVDSGTKAGSVSKVVEIDFTRLRAG